VIYYAAHVVPGSTAIEGGTGTCLITVHACEPDGFLGQALTGSPVSVSGDTWQGLDRAIRQTVENWVIAHVYAGDSLAYREAVIAGRSDADRARIYGV
jgi:hypothetical protein